MENTALTLGRSQDVALDRGRRRRRGSTRRPYGRVPLRKRLTQKKSHHSHPKKSADPPKDVALDDSFSRGFVEMVGNNRSVFKSEDHLPIQEISEDKPLQCVESSSSTRMQEYTDNHSRELIQRSVTESHGSPNVDTSVPLDLLIQVKHKFDLFSFDRWHALVHSDSALNNAIHAVLLSAQINTCVQRSIVFSTNGHVELYVHCKPVDVTPFLLNASDPVILSNASVNDFVQRIGVIVNNVRKMEVCCGFDEEALKLCWKTCTYGKIDENPYSEGRYAETFRSFTCKLLVKREAWRCSECAKLQGLLPLQRRSHSDI